MVRRKRRIRPRIYRRDLRLFPCHGMLWITDRKHRLKLDRLPVNRPILGRRPWPVEKKLPFFSPMACQRPLGSKDKSPGSASILPPRKATRGEPQGILRHQGGTTRGGKPIQVGWGMSLAQDLQLGTFPICKMNCASPDDGAPRTSQASLSWCMRSDGFTFTHVRSSSPTSCSNSLRPISWKWAARSTDGRVVAYWVESDGPSRASGACMLW